MAKVQLDYTQPTASASTLSSQSPTTTLTPGLQYVGSQLQYVSASGQILPPSAAPAANTANTTSASTASSTKPVTTPVTTSSTTSAAIPATSTGPAAPTVVSTSTPGVNGVETLTWSNGTTTTINTGVSQSALALLTSTLQGYGLDSNGTLSSAIMGLIQDNYDASTIAVLAQDPASVKSTDPSVAALATAWNARFPGNTARQAAGLAPLDPATYISTEQSYQAVLSRAGIPASSPLMQPSYIGQLMGNDLSPAEVDQRVTAAQTAITATDPYTVAALQQNFGLTPTDMVTHLLDPSVAASTIQQKVTASQIQAEASRNGLSTDLANAMYLAGAGVNQTQAQTGYGKVANVLPAATNISNIYGNQTGLNYNQQSAEQQYLLNNGQAALTQQKLSAYETANFQGQSGINPGVETLRKSMQGKF